MRIRTPGKIQEQLWLLGREESGVYLLKGDDGFTMINGGLSYIIPELLQQEEIYRSTGDIDVVSKKLVSYLYDKNPDYFLTPEIFLEVYRQMVRHIASAMEGKD